MNEYQVTRRYYYRWAYSLQEALWIIERAFLERWVWKRADAPRVIKPARVISLIRRFFVRRLPMWSCRRWRSVT